MILPGGQKSTLETGDFMVMGGGGVMQEWSNPYEEDCVFVVTLVGARRCA
jgi:hypothetical protein